MKTQKTLVIIISVFVLAGLFGLQPSPVQAVSPDVVISQVYGGGGNSGATYTHDFIELFNRGSSTVSIAGWSVQYASVTGTGNFGANSGQITELPSVSLAPGRYFLIQEASNAAVGAPLPTPDMTDASPINLAATGGKVALVNTTTPLGCNGGSTPCSPAALATIVDLVGYGSANFFEGSGPTPAPSNTTAVLRLNDGCVDTDNNASDFTIGAPTPRNSSSPLKPCSVALTPIHDIQGASHISPKVGMFVKTTGIVTAKRTNGFYIQDPNPDADEATSEAIFVFTGSAPTVSVGDSVEVTGTVKEFRPGGSNSTNLTTTEIDNPGRTVTILSSGNSLPDPIIIGTGGRIPPSTVIEDDATGDVETSGVFDPANDGLDFYESLEGMLVQVNNAVAVGPTTVFGEIPVLGDDGANAGVRTMREGIVVRPDDFNPERIILSEEIALLPDVNVGDHFESPIIGVLDYSFGNFKLLVTETPVATSGGLTREIATAPPTHQLSVALFSTENLSPNDPPSKFNAQAGQIVNNLKSPDLIALMEIQDNNGSTNDGVVDANNTFQMLIDAIGTAGGPTYDYRQINPVNNQDGGEPGGNIRVGFLFRTDRGLSFIDRVGATSTTANAVMGTGAGTQLLYSPGRIDPTNAAFANSRKPLAGEFSFNGDKVFVIANHFNSKGGDDPLFGHFQPPVLSSELQRIDQAQVVHDFVDEILTADANANVVVLGNLNDFEFSQTVLTLTGSILNDLIETLPVDERYTYNFEGNSETLDHILLSDAPFGRPFAYDVVHVNSEFVEQASDHDPQVAHLCVDSTPPSLTVSVSPNSLWPPNHEYVTVRANLTVSDNADPAPALVVSVTSNEPDNGLGDGDKPNDIVIVDNFTFKLRAERSGTGNGRIYTITYRATDACGNTRVATATVTVPHSQGKK